MSFPCTTLPALKHNRANMKAENSALSWEPGAAKGAFMSKRRKGAVRRGHGAMCNICGRNCGKGGALKKHIESAHGVEYEAYKTCFYGKPRESSGPLPYGTRVGAW